MTPEQQRTFSGWSQRLTLQKRKQEGFRHEEDSALLLPGMWGPICKDGREACTELTVAPC